MAEQAIRDAIRSALQEEMRRDERVFILGEEVAEYDGPYKVTKGMLEEFGPQRILDTPITELGFTGLAVGAALAGLRPVVEWMTFNFSLLALDQVINNAAKMRYMSGGQFSCPIVFRGPNGPAEYLAAQHSHALQSYYAHIPGLKVIAPATAHDSKGMLKSAIRDDNPVVVLESELAYAWKDEVPEGEYLIPLGRADIKRPGTEVTVVVHGKVLRPALAAAAALEQQGVDVEVLDLRSLRPLDEEAIIASVRKTHRAVVVDESWPFASVGSHVGWLISNKCFDQLDAQVELVCTEDVPMPYNHQLEVAAQPSEEKIIAAIKRVLYI